MFSFKKSFLIYGLGAALNRASGFLLLPLATQTFSIEDFGLYSLALVVAQLSFPFFSLNGQVAVVREGAVDNKLGLQLLTRCLILTVALGSLTFALLYLFAAPLWLKYGLLLGALEASHHLFFAYLRITNCFYKYLFTTAAKALILAAVFLLFYQQDQALQPILMWTTIAYGFISVFLFFALGLQKLASTPLAPYLPYCLLLLPSGVYQWVISSSDRFVIKSLLDDHQLGIYSIGYALAMLVMLPNQGIALAVPQLMMKDLKSWIRVENRLRFLTKVSGLNCLVFAGLCFIVVIDFLFLGWIQNLNREVFKIACLVGAAAMTMSFYYLYCNVLFFHKKTGLLSLASFATALLNIALTIALVPKLGIVGAAYGTFLSYAFYVLIVGALAFRVEKSLQFSPREGLLLGRQILFVAGMFYFLSPLFDV